MAKDIIHDAVKQALIKDGWVITHEPYTLIFDGEPLYADLAAEHPIAAERDGHKIVVEIKSFMSRSVVQDFKEALGQYLLYRDLLEETEPEYHSYLAISDKTYFGAFQRSIVQFMVKRYQISLIIIDVELEVIVEWKK